MSTGTSFTLVSADFNSAGMESYFLNHCSARFLSPVASISSSSLPSVAVFMHQHHGQIAFHAGQGCLVFAHKLFADGKHHVVHARVHKILEEDFLRSFFLVDARIVW